MGGSHKMEVLTLRRWQILLVAVWALLVCCSAEESAGLATELLKWAGERGVALSRELSIVWDEGTSKLLVKPQEKMRGHELVRVPLRACVGVLDAFDQLPERSDGSVPTFSYPEEVLVMWFLYQRSLGSFSAFAPYLTTFADREKSSLPLLLTERQWEWMEERGVDVRNERWRVAREKEELRYYFEQLEVNVLQLDPISFPPDSFTFDDYLWAYASIVSRAFVCGGHGKEGSSGDEGGPTARHLAADTCHDGDCAGREERERQTEDSPLMLKCRPGEPLLVPFLDLLPRTRRQEVAVELQWSGESIRLRAGDGTRGFLNVFTGEMTEMDAFHAFGMAERPYEHIPDAEVPIFVDLMPMTTWRMFVLPWIRNAAPEYFSKYGRFLEEYSVPSEVEWSAESLRVARLLTADGNAPPAELRHIISGAHVGEGYSLEKEFRALRFLYTRAEALAEQLPVTTAALAEAVEDMRIQFSPPAHLATGSLVGGPGEAEANSYVTPAVVATVQHRTHQVFEAGALMKRLVSMWASLLEAA